MTQGITCALDVLWRYPLAVKPCSLGNDTLDFLCFLMDGDVYTLCKNVKCAGGAAGGNNRGAYLGHLVSQKTEMIIKLAAYYLRYSEKIS